MSHCFAVEYLLTPILFFSILFAHAAAFLCARMSLLFSSPVSHMLLFHPLSSPFARLWSLPACRRKLFSTQQAKWRRPSPFIFSPKRAATLPFFSRAAFHSPRQVEFSPAEMPAPLASWPALTCGCERLVPRSPLLPSSRQLPPRFFLRIYHPVPRGFFTFALTPSKKDN